MLSTDIGFLKLLLNFSWYLKRNSTNITSNLTKASFKEVPTVGKGLICA